MPKFVRRQPKNPFMCRLNPIRVVGITLALAIGFLLFNGIRTRIRRKEESGGGGHTDHADGTATAGQSPNNLANNGNVTGGLIVDLECLERIAQQAECQFPVRIALRSGQEYVNDSQFVRVDFSLIDLPKRDFWLFKGVQPAGNVSMDFAVKRFPTKRAWIRMYGTTGKNALPVDIAQLSVPSDIPAFIRSWQNGRFFDCVDPLLVRPTDVERVIPLAYVNRIAEFADLIAQFNATAFLTSGTLLGWRRECSLIPHTNDIDLGIFYEQHSDSLLRAILTSPTFIVHWVLGRLRDSFELAVNVDGFKIDLFYVYTTVNGSHVGGMRPQKRQHLRWHYPKLSGQICAAELHGKLMHVPCDYQKLIDSDYGAEGWKHDSDTNTFVWDKDHPNKQSLEVFTDAEWPNVFLLVQNKTERFDPLKVNKWMANIKKTA